MPDGSGMKLIRLLTAMNMKSVAMYGKYFTKIFGSPSVGRAIDCSANS